MSNALNLLSYYTSDAEDEDSDDKQRFPLPDSLKENFPPPYEDLVDDPEQHDGRVRRYPHQRGNWNSIVYIPFDRDLPFDQLCDQIVCFCQPTVALKRILEPHVSLTRTFVLLYHWIDNFVSSVKNSLQSFSRFDLQFDGLKVYCNEDDSRTFLALTVGFGKMEINKTVQLLDKCLGEYKLHPFYDVSNLGLCTHVGDLLEEFFRGWPDLEYHAHYFNCFREFLNEASFHMSIAWALGNKKVELEGFLPDLNKIFDASLNDDLDLTISIRNYICKVGHKVYNFKLL